MAALGKMPGQVARLALTVEFLKWAMVGGAEPELLLQPTPYAWVKGDAESIWLSRFDHYPNVSIMSCGGEGLIVNRFESEAHLRRWIFETERELAA